MRSQRGQAIVLIALMLTIVIGMAAIAIDGSRAYALRRDMQAAVDAASLAAGDKLQQAGNWTSAEQAATTIFGMNLHLYAAPSCSPYGSPAAAPFTVTCTYADGTVLTEVAQAVGPQGSQFTVSAQRNLQLQFGRILTNGTSPTIAVSAIGGVGNLRYTPAVGALASSGCGPGGTAITINGSGTMGVTGDIVSNGSITVSSGAARVAGDIYARCQSPVPGAVSNACYPSGASTPCTYPDIAGATRSGFYLADPKYPPPNLAGGSQSSPNANVVLLPGNYASLPSLNGGHCWFLSGGVYNFQAGLLNLGDLVSNELKPPDEPVAGNNSQRATQFWDAHGTCGGSFQVQKVTGSSDLPTGMWSFEVTSVRTDTYNGFGYQRESAPSMCHQVNLNNHFDDVQIMVSNVPGATSYNIYAAPPGNGCGGPFGLAGNLPVSGPVLNSNLNPCPAFTGNGCSLSHESIDLEAQLEPPFAPNALAAPGTIGAYPPDAETAPLAAGLPNQNPARGVPPRGDRANENDCETAGGVRTSCPGPITPGAVELYFPSGGCLFNGNGADLYVFSGAQYDWISVYEPGPANPPANLCANTFGAASNSGFAGMVYTPSASDSITSPYAFEVAGTGGIMAATIGLSGTLPAITYNGSYAPVPPATRLTG